MVEYVELVKVVINVFTAMFVCISLSFTLCVCVIRNSLLATICSLDEYVLDNVCTQCAPGSKRAKGDEATGPDTECAGKRS